MAANRKFIVELRRGGKVNMGRAHGFYARFKPYFVLKGGNGEVISCSESYTRTTTCTRMAKKVAAALGTTVRGSWR